MILSNSRTMFSVSEESENLKLNGELTIIDNMLITNFYGNFSLENPTDTINNSGTFHFSETETTVNKNINGVAKEHIAEATMLLDNTILQIKNK